MPLGVKVENMKLLPQAKALSTYYYCCTDIVTLLF